MKNNSLQHKKRKRDKYKKPITGKGGYNKNIQGGKLDPNAE
jgi:hypothetical protein